MAARTLALVSGLTFGWPLSTRETVWWDTPACRATSAMTGLAAGRLGVDITQPSLWSLASRPPALPSWLRTLTCRTRQTIVQDPPNAPQHRSRSPGPAARVPQPGSRSPGPVASAGRPRSGTAPDAHARAPGSAGGARPPGTRG